MNTPFSPQLIIPDALIRQLRGSAAAAERTGTLTEDQLSIVFREGWFRMFLPRSLGGLELSLTEGLRLEEVLAWIDGSLGWTITLCSGATMFAGYLEPSVAARLLSDPQACFGGSGQASGIAAITPDGYRVSGKWKYATGAPHLSVFTANCRIERDGAPLTDADGEPVVRSFFFMRDEVRIIEDWHTMGLKATAGHTFEVFEKLLPADRAFTISPDGAMHAGMIYRYPFLPFAEATLAVNTLGMAQHFLEICEQLFAQRGSNKHYPEETVRMLNTAMIRAKHELGELRDNFYHAVEHSWTPLLHQRLIRPEALQAVGVCSRGLVANCRRIAQELFPYCGMAAANPSAELNRIWRDLFTASQHTLLTYPA
jgi:alkylation response protein AidB-like acyl-CoA dehydrogenase